MNCILSKSCMQIWWNLWEVLKTHILRGISRLSAGETCLKCIIYNKWYDEHEKTVESENKRIIITAARLITASILKACYSVDEYSQKSTLKDRVERVRARVGKDTYGETSKI